MRSFQKHQLTDRNTKISRNTKYLEIEGSDPATLIITPSIDSKIFRGILRNKMRISYVRYQPEVND